MKTEVIIIAIQLALSLLAGYILISFVMMGFNPSYWGIVARVSFLVVSAACMFGLIKTANNG